MKAQIGLYKPHSDQGLPHSLMLSTVYTDSIMEAVTHRLVWTLIARKYDKLFFSYVCQILLYVLKQTNQKVFSQNC